MPKKDKQKKKPEDHLPKRAPKKTGKRGPRPLDASADFDNPVRKEAEEPVQGELIKEPTPPAPPAIQHGKIAMHFVGYKAKRSKDRDKIVNMDFSLELTDAHRKHIPREIEDAWHELENNQYRSVEPNGSAEHNLALYLASDQEEPDLATVATLSKAVVSRIQERGKGEARKITRLVMRFVTELTKDVDHFCVNAYDETVYAKIEAAQRSFGEE